MSNIDKLVLKSAVNGFYTIQKSRIQIGNALVANFKEKLGQDAGATEETLDIDAEM